MKILQTLNIADVALISALKNADSALPAVDTLGRGALLVVVTPTTLTVDLTGIKLVESDDNATFTDVPGGALPAPAPVMADAGKTVAIHVDLLGRKRYIKLVISAANGGAGTGATVVVTSILGESQNTPDSAATRGFTRELFV